MTRALKGALLAGAMAISCARPVAKVPQPAVEPPQETCTPGRLILPITDDLIESLSDEPPKTPEKKWANLVYNAFKLELLAWSVSKDGPSAEKAGGNSSDDSSWRDDPGFSTEPSSQINERDQRNEPGFENSVKSNWKTESGL